MKYAELERAGTWTYLKCKTCFHMNWYHEKDPRNCKKCGKQTLVTAPPAKNEAEREHRSRQLGLW